jgi:hypothetical protein
MRNNPDSKAAKQQFITFKREREREREKIVFQKRIYSKVKSIFCFRTKNSLNKD